MLDVKFLFSFDNSFKLREPKRLQNQYNPTYIMFVYVRVRVNLVRGVCLLCGQLDVAHWSPTSVLVQHIVTLIQFLLLLLLVPRFYLVVCILDEIIPIFRRGWWNTLGYRLQGGGQWSKRPLQVVAISRNSIVVQSGRRPALLLKN